MSKFIMKIKKIIPTRRKLIQLYTALLFNANLKGFKTGDIYQGNSKNICMPGINCYSCPGATTACPMGSLQGAINSDNKSTLYYVFGIILLYSILFGRLICGWLCPFGLIQELLYKIKTPKIKKNPITKVLSYVKYFVLVFFVFVVPILYALRDETFPAFCKYICPAGTFEGGIMLLSNKANEGELGSLGALFTWKFLLLVSVIVTSVFIFRVFCRFICPLGALYSLFNKISVFGIKVDNSKCTHCGLCINRCKMDIRTVGDKECISCGDCADVCPTKAIQWKKPFKRTSLPETISGNKKLRLATRITAAVVLIALLISSIVFYWNDGMEKNKPSADPQQTVGENNTSTTTGTELNIITSEAITEDKIVPEHTGKLTIVNFWGTWCGPCVAELPFFDAIATEYKDKVTVIAVHTNMVSDSAPGFIKEHYPESDIIFALDYPDSKYYTALGGRNAYPYTAVLDENGSVVRTFAKTLEYEDLKEIVESELNK